MGWVAYKLKRSNTTTGEELGEITIIFPQLSDTLLLDGKRLALSELLSQYPDFPIEAHVFVSPGMVSIAADYGFGNLINIVDYAGETWTMSNGSKIVFGSSGDSSDQYSLSFYDKNGNEIYGTFTGDYRDTGRVCWLPCYYGDGQTGNMTSALLYKYGTKYLTLLFNDNVPERYWSPEQFPFFAGATPIYITDDPFGDGGITEPGGGEGDFNGTSTPISIPALPTLSAVDAGFITLFNPSLAEMNNLASYMWSDLFDVNGWKKVFADPMNAILGLSIVPVNVPSSGTKPVKVGNISTGVNMTVASSQYVEVDCGTLNINEYWGAYLDYDPYTKAEIYLPYIGIHPISTDDIMNKPLRVVYHIDILSGACCAYLQCGGTVLYSFIGQCASSIPITGDNWTNVINGAISIAGAIGSMVATGGATAPMSAGTIASTAVNTMKSNIEKSGSMSGTGGLLGVQTPYMILTRPRQALPFNQNSFMGYPSFINESLSGLSGYTEVESIHLENVPATEQELTEIETLLKSGVIF